MKGQLFSIDLLVAVTIFFFVLGLAVYFWLIMPSVQTFDIQEKTNLISEYLVSYRLGTENVLDCWEVSNLSSNNYNDTKEELNVAPYDIYVEFKNTSNICDGNETSIGEPVSATKISSVARIVYLDEKIMQMIVRLYD